MWDFYTIKKKRIQKSTNLDLDWFMMIMWQSLKSVWVTVKTFREKINWFFFQSIWYSNHILISPLVDLGPSLVDLGLRENNSSKCFHLLVGSMTTVYLCSCDTCLKRMSDAENAQKKEVIFYLRYSGTLVAPLYYSQSIWDLGESLLLLSCADKQCD